VPVIFMQIEMRDSAREAREKDWPAAAALVALFRRGSCLAFRLRILCNWHLLVILAKPGFWFLTA